MKTITLGYTKFGVPSNWTTKQLGEFAAQLAELSTIESASKKVGESWVTAYYVNAEKGVTIAQFSETVHPNYTVAQAYLDAMSPETETA